MIIMLIIITITLPFYVTQRSSTNSGLESILKEHSILSYLGIFISKKDVFFSFSATP